jgi:ArsR family transcriptional regulator
MEIQKGGICNSGEIVEALPLAQSTVFQHLKQLLKEGRIRETTDGIKSCYGFNGKAFGKFEKSFKEFSDTTKFNN